MSIFKKVINKVRSTIGDGIHLVKFRETKYGSQYHLNMGNVMIGYLDLLPNDIKEFNGKRYMNIFLVHVEPEYRGRGYGTIMYKKILKFLPSNIDGIYSEPYTRHNTVQVPRIHKSLGGVEDENGVVYIDK